MAVRDILPVVAEEFEETLTSASPDLLREVIRQMAQPMMDAEIEQVCGAGYGEVSEGRVNSRDGIGGGPGPSSRPCRDCGRGRTAPSGCWSGGAGPSGRWRRWWPRPLCWGLDPAGGEAGRAAGRHPAVQVAGQRAGPGTA
ncbi:hypothetical protein GCM10010411_13520 [Actinomadura fulvescens]|uniref:Transposase n=1 Tax=Actinomadura fulvescens TaxID=46160 RepID=A0ABP6BTZ0_9ACTN